MGECMPKEQLNYLLDLQNYMLEWTNMNKVEAWSFALRCWKFRNKEEFIRLVRGEENVCNK